jgi:hypothetical protein
VVAGFDQRLGRAFDFGPDDLAANRSGQLSRDQSVMFANAVRVGARRERRVLPVLVGLLVVTLVLVVVGSGATDDLGAAAPALGVAAVMLTFMGTLVVAFRRRDAANRATMSAAALDVVEGGWQLDPSLDGTWRIRVGDRLIAADRLALEALADGAVYRFYVMPFRGVTSALSVERVDR